MSFSTLRLTNIARLTINMLLALAIYTLLTWLPSFNFKWLLGFFVLALLATWISGANN